MEQKNPHLTPTEWYLMECLWKEAPRTGREAVEYLSAHVGWSRSTTLTMLRRMTEKGFVRCDEANGISIYFPVLSREDAVRHETDCFLERVFQGNVSLMVSTLTEKQPLTQREIETLHALLHKAEEANKHD